MIQEKVGAVTGVVGTLTGAASKTIEWVTQFITLRNIAIVMGMWFLIWLWLKIQEQNHKDRSAILPYR